MEKSGREMSEEEIDEFETWRDGMDMGGVFTAVEKVISEIIKLAVDPNRVVSISMRLDGMFSEDGHCDEIFKGVMGYINNHEPGPGRRW